MKPFLAPFSGIVADYPPCWFMRQAGRYLPEYRKIRESAGDFLVMCYTPDLATEITLQPIRRFGMDAAIIFSDILVVPHGLGQPLEFIKGYGPKLEPLVDEDELNLLNVERMVAFLHPVYQAIRQTRAALASHIALIGFAGAPWTLLCYMLDGNGKQDFVRSRTAIYEHPKLVERTIALLTHAIIEHLCQQIEAGADAVQIFDSWASHVPATHREMLVYQPTRMIVQALKARYPHVPVICFPRAIGAHDVQHFDNYVQPDGLSVDYTTDMAALYSSISPSVVLQGNLDPLALMASKEVICAQARALVQLMKGRPFVMNLGHGVLPQTPPEHMQALIETIRSGSA